MHVIRSPRHCLSLPDCCSRRLRGSAIGHSSGRTDSLLDGYGRSCGPFPASALVSSSPVTSQSSAHTCFPSTTLQPCTVWMPLPPRPRLPSRFLSVPGLLLRSCAYHCSPSLFGPAASLFPRCVPLAASQVPRFALQSPCALRVWCSDRVSNDC